MSGTASLIETLIANSITFLPGTADSSNNAAAVLYEVGKVLAQLKLPVVVEGCSVSQETNRSIAGWQLSAQRAINILNYLQRAGIQGQRLSARVFAHSQAPLSGDVVAPS